MRWPLSKAPSIGTLGTEQFGPGLASIEAGAVEGTGGKGLGGLDDRFEPKLRQLIADAAEEGLVIGLGSGFRTHAEQVALKAAKPGLAATPGNSNHEFGLAGDLTFGNDLARQYAHQNAAKYGLNFPMLGQNGGKNEPWHVEPIGAKGMRNGGDSGFATTAEREAAAKAATDKTTAEARARDTAAQAAQRQADQINGVVDSLKFEDAQLSRTELAQDINNQLRAAGVTIDSAAGQQISALTTARFNHAAAIDKEKEALEKQKEAAADALQAQKQIEQELGSAFSGAFSGFLSDLRNGKSAAEALQGALTKLGDQLISMATNALFQNLFTGLLSGGGAGGGLFGFASGGPVKGFASGGYISGSGGPRSDSIPAMLSNGEYVVNSASTKRFGPLLQAINEGRVGHFANGGPVSGGAPMMAGGGGVTVNSPISVTVEKSSGDAAQDDRYAKMISGRIEESMRHVVVDEIIKQQRSGGIVPKRRALSDF